MTMHTDKYCDNLDNLDRAKAIRAIHEAWLQLSAMGHRPEINGTTYDNVPALHALADCLHEAGHMGFPNKPEPPEGGPDAAVTYEGSFALVCPYTDAAAAWLCENADAEPWQWRGAALVVDRRMADELRAAMEAAGLSVA
jgi:hypothetical protein